MILNFHSTNAYDKYCKCVSELTNIFPYVRIRITFKGKDAIKSHSFAT